MRTEIVQAWKDYSLFEMKLNEKIKAKQQYYEIIDILILETEKTQ